MTIREHRSSGMSRKPPLPQQSEAGPAEHPAFERLDPVDVSSGGAGAPGQGAAGDDGIAITVDACGEGVEAVEGVGLVGVRPLPS
ncbi:hypothetical protein [Streptomyces sp. t39]|uniref:hypothetical protein n=1 Tax=Streptomyces sp. t39 TaxID=1828156 RepID=UPI001650CA6C|nr:hypothetical protein [Streptomyces sp. t39]